MTGVTRAAATAALLLFGALAGYAATLLHIPLPWMIGPIVVAGGLTLAADVAAPPVQIRMAGQLVIGATMGLYLVPEAVARITGAVLPILISAVLSIVAAVIVGVVQARFLRTDKATAIYSSVPGGPIDMANLAEHHGGDPARTALTQTIRIVLIIVLFPQILLIIGSTLHEIDIAGSGPVAIPELALLTAGCLVASYAAKIVRLLNPFFMGPLLFVGGLTAMSLPMPAVPPALVAGGQVLLGASIGCMFRRDLFRNGLVFIAVSVTSTMTLLGLCLLLGAGLSHVFGLDLETMILAAAPGGATEMAVTAKAMNLDVPLVVAFQMIRVILVASCLPLIFALFMRLSRTA